MVEWKQLYWGECHALDTERPPLKPPTKDCGWSVFSIYLLILTTATTEALLGPKSHFSKMLHRRARQHIAVWGIRLLYLVTFWREGCALISTGTILKKKKKKEIATRQRGVDLRINDQKSFFTVAWWKQRLFIDCSEQSPTVHSGEPSQVFFPGFWGNFTAMF